MEVLVCVFFSSCCSFLLARCFVSSFFFFSRLFSFCVAIVFECDRIYGQLCFYRSFIGRFLFRCGVYMLMYASLSHIQRNSVFICFSSKIQMTGNRDTDYLHFSFSFAVPINVYAHVIFIYTTRQFSL